MHTHISRNSQHFRCQDAVGNSVRLSESHGLKHVRVKSGKRARRAWRHKKCMLAGPRLRLTCFFLSKPNSGWAFGQVVSCHRSLETCRVVLLSRVTPMRARSFECMCVCVCVCVCVNLSHSLVSACDHIPMRCSSCPSDRRHWVCSMQPGCTC